MEQIKNSELNEIIGVVTNYTEGCKKGDTSMMHYQRKSGLFK